MLHNLYSEPLNSAKVAGGYVPPCPHTSAQCRVFCKCKSLTRQKKTIDLRLLINLIGQTMAEGSCVKTVNDSYTLKPKKGRTRLYRTNSLARELKKLGVPFSFFQRDTIHFSLYVTDFSHIEIYISATRDQYTYKKQYFKFNAWEFDETLESIDTTGKDLLSVLVYLGELPERFQPEGGAVIS